MSISTYEHMLEMFIEKFIQTRSKPFERYSSFTPKKKRYSGSAAYDLVDLVSTMLCRS